MTLSDADAHDLRTLCALWSAEPLADAVTVRYSGRLSRSIARCTPAKRDIRLNVHLRDAPAAFRREVLCHELAHLVAYERHGAGIRPHGAEWASLVRAAGYEPHVRLPWPASMSTAVAASRARARAARARWLHRCPVCRVSRAAARAMRAWRCRECVDSGRDGKLSITRLSGSGTRASPAASGPRPT